jgi:hypothetical protein
MKLVIPLALLLAACAVARQPLAPAREDDEAQARAAEERSLRLEQELSAPLAGATPPDCGHVCDLVGQICDLSERICSIASRHGDDRDLAARCAAARQRCNRSRETAKGACSCH